MDGAVTRPTRSGGAATLCPVVAGAVLGAGDADVPEPPQPPASSAARDHEHRREERPDHWGTMPETARGGHQARPSRHSVRARYLRGGLILPAAISFETAVSFTFSAAAFEKPGLILPKLTPLFLMLNRKSPDENLPALTSLIVL